MEAFLDVVKNALGKAVTFITSRRVWLLGLLASIFAVLGFVGLDSDLAGEIVDATGGVLDQSAVVIAAVALLVERLGVLAGLVMVAYRAMSSFDTRPPVMEDWKDSHKVAQVNPAPPK